MVHDEAGVRERSRWVCYVCLGTFLKVYYRDAGTKGGIEVVASDGDVWSSLARGLPLSHSQNCSQAAPAAPVGLNGLGQ